MIDMQQINVALNEIASIQHGLVTRLQARTAGLSRSALAHRLRRGDWLAEGPLVLRRAGSADTPAQRALMAVLDAGPGAVLSHAAAAAWWGLPGFDLRVLHVTRPRHITSSPVRFGRLHEVLDLISEHVTILEGVPIVRPERLILELCGSEHPARAERALDNAWSRRLLSGASLRRVHAELAERGRKGTVLLRELLVARDGDYVPPASGLEARVQSVLADAGIRTFRRQVDTGDDSWIGRVDFRDAEVPLIIEVQSERYHASLCDRRADEERLARLAAAGFSVVPIWDVDVWRRPAEVVERVRAARRTLIRRLDRAS